jgi:glutaredoxin-like protein
MSLISPADQERLRADFATMPQPVRLLFFTQTFDGDACVQTRRILDELPPLSDKVTIEEVNFVLEAETASRYGIDRVPSIALVGQSASGDTFDARVRFVGMPAGYEFVSLVRAIMLVGGAPPQLSATSRARIAAVDKPVTVRVFSTPTCPHCPRAVNLAVEMARANDLITSYAVEITEYPDLARRYHVSGVPKTVVNDRVEILGALPEEAFVEQALAEFLATADSPQAGEPPRAGGA